MAYTRNRIAFDITAAATLVDMTTTGIAAGKGGTYELRLTNRTASATTVRVAISTSATAGGVGNGEYIEFDTKLLANGKIANYPLPLDVGDRVYVYAATANAVSALLHGITEP